MKRLASPKKIWGLQWKFGGLQRKFVSFQLVYLGRQWKSGGRQRRSGVVNDILGVSNEKLGLSNEKVAMAECSVSSRESVSEPQLQNVLKTTFLCFVQQQKFGPNRQIIIIIKFHMIITFKFYNIFITKMFQNIKYIFSSSITRNSRRFAPFCLGF